MALSDPKKVLLMTHDVPRHFIPKILMWGPPNFCYRAKMGLRKVVCRYEKPSKTQTT